MRPILDIGTGKRWTQYLDPKYEECTISCIDKSYHTIDKDSRIVKNITLYDCDIFKFLEAWNPPFGLISAHRIFEHIDYQTIPYLLYLCKENLCGNGIIDIIVPDYEQILSRINNINYGIMTPIKFNREMIDCHTECFNTPEDPHRSIWTKTLAKYYFELEDFWDNIEITPDCILDNRDWYLRITAKRKTF